MNYNMGYKNDMGSRIAWKVWENGEKEQTRDRKQV